MKLENLRNAITENMTLSKMASKLGISRQCFYYKMKIGEFTLIEITKIVEILSRVNGRNYTIEELFGGVRIKWEV